MAATFRGEREDVGSGSSPFDLATTEATRGRSRLPEVLVGTLLVALFALAGAWFYSTSTAEVGYLALRESVGRGELIEQSDLTVYQLSTDAPVRALRVSELPNVVGMVTLTDLEVGTLVTPELFAETADIPVGFGIVGLDLVPGEFSSASLRPGDRVRVVLTSAGSGTASGSPVVLAESVEIVEVVDGGGRGRFISIALDLELADRVALADARGEVRLIQVPES